VAAPCCRSGAPSSGRRRFAASLSCILLAVAAPGLASAADFYDGKTVTVIVGFAPGGGVDTTARVLAKHLVRHIPGQPAVVVQNMEGAAGIVAANHLNGRVAGDGLTLAVPGRSWFVEGVVKSPGVAFDVNAVTYIGSPGGSNSMIYLRASTGITSYEALKTHPQTLTFGALGSATPTAMVPVMLAGHGMPIKVVLGYVSTARVLLALEQGEVDGVFTVEDSFGRRQDMIGNKVVVPVLQSQPLHAGIPLVQDVLPKSEAQLLSVIRALDTFGLPLVGPPGIPADRVAILRKAFLDMCADKEFQADAAKIDLPVGAPISGARLAQMINELAAAATPDIVTAYRRLATGGGKGSVK
jgi:tripartite-type tricarboxylate transporter receptor subunit TctC